jgi:putative chitinase
METGTFTGRKFADFFVGPKTDWLNARRIINGKDCAEIIEIYARKFYAALSHTV